MCGGNFVNLFFREFVFLALRINRFRQNDKAELQKNKFTKKQNYRRPAYAL